MTEVIQRRLRPRATPDVIFPRIPLSIFSFAALSHDDHISVYLRWEPKHLAVLKPTIKGVGLSDIEMLKMARGTHLRFPKARDESVTLVLEGNEISVPVDPLETELFEGLNTLLAVTLEPEARHVAAWAKYHVETQGAEAALLINRVKQDETSSDFCAELEGLLAQSGLKKIIVLDCPAPLGGRAPDARSRLMAPDAPGRKKGIPVPVDPWTAPFFEFGILRVVLDRFLSDANAVLLCEIADLVEGGAGSVFEAASAGTGLIKFQGRHAYPFSLQGVDFLQHGHHTVLSFDGALAPSNLCFCPQKIATDAAMRLYRIGELEPDPKSSEYSYFRSMGLKHPNLKVSHMVPKSSLVRDARLDAVRAKLPKVKLRSLPAAPKPAPVLSNARVLIVTTMKNEGPFILEWLAYHRAIGVTDFLVYTNDCSDGTDAMFDLLAKKGLLEHRQNPYRQTKERPQHAALFDAQTQDITRAADWVIPMDVDEYINIHVGDGTLTDLFAAVPDASMISMTWRLFGNAGVAGFEDRFITEQFVDCAPKLCRKPHQAWGFKTAFRNLDHYRKFGVHRPKGLKPEHLGEIRWVNGSGTAMPKSVLRSGWRSSIHTIGYDLVTLNHYSLRSAESFLVKRDRGRVNHVERDQGLNYWFRMNHNKERDRSILRMTEKQRVEYERLMSDPDIAAQHMACVQAHQTRIAELLGDAGYREFYDEITGERLNQLSRMLENFGTKVFLEGPNAVPPDFHLKDTQRI